MHVREMHAYETHVYEMHASKTRLSEACAYEIHDYELLVSAFLCCFCIGPHFGFRIGASKITALLAVKILDARGTQAYL